MKKSLLKNYAKLIARIGGSVEEGGEVFIFAETGIADFVALLAEECYAAGASNVFVEWRSGAMRKLARRFETVKSLSFVPSWEESRMSYRCEKLPVCISLLSEAPEEMKDSEREKERMAQQARSAILKPYQDRMTNRYQWCVAGVPSAEWAKKIFPEDRAGRGVEKLWELILKVSRADGKDPLTDWMWHNRNLREKCDKLNSLDLASLEYRSSNGTDFHVGLIGEAQFISGRKSTTDGKHFNPNIPTEEVFTTPERGVAEGVVYASKPLVYGGEIIEDFYLRFEGGKVVEVHAEKNEEVLKNIVGFDEGAAYLGECALVPFDSPINQSGVLFYNTLYDENACCHLALGRGYSNTIKDFGKYTSQDFAKMGVNDSAIHVDFMIGTEDLEITGITKSGQRVKIFEKGGWAI